MNVRNTGEYIRKVLAGESPTFQSEHLAGEDRARETIAIQLRRCDGIDRSSFHIQTGFDLDALIGEKVKQYVGLGLLEDTGQGSSSRAKGNVSLTASLPKCYDRHKEFAEVPRTPCGLARSIAAVIAGILLLTKVVLRAVGAVAERDIHDLTVGDRWGAAL